MNLHELSTLIEDSSDIINGIIFCPQREDFSMMVFILVQ